MGIRIRLAMVPLDIALLSSHRQSVVLSYLYEFFCIKVPLIRLCAFDSFVKYGAICKCVLLA